MMKLSSEQLQLISMLEQNSGVQAVDALAAPESIVFVVKQGDLGRAIGKNASNLERLERKFGRRVEFVEFDSDLNGFLKNLFKPVALENVEFNENAGGQTVVLKVDFKNKGLAIGRGGSKINRARELVKRHFGIAELKIL
ncbi:MAG: NusA-like transcription termination signal-binding factor [Candidatus Micrarchaeota archaeon]